MIPCNYSSKLEVVFYHKQDVDTGSKEGFKTASDVLPLSGFFMAIIVTQTRRGINGVASCSWPSLFPFPCHS
jgi:hypothetical protein